MKETIGDGGSCQVRDRESTLSGAFQDHAGSIYRFIYAKVGSHAVAEDLTSQVFLKAVRWLAGDYDAQSIRSWLYATARTALVDYWRERSEYQIVPLDDSMALLFFDGGEEKEVARTRERARRILGALPARESTVLRLRFLRGYTAAEIGRELGIEPGNVRVIQLRALRRAAALVLPNDAVPAGAARERGTSAAR
jgi:RNA polymerase sigma-70 factor (ECF subfamily)